MKIFSWFVAFNLGLFFFGDAGKAESNPEINPGDSIIQKVKECQERETSSFTSRHLDNKMKLEVKTKEHFLSNGGVNEYALALTTQITDAESGCAVEFGLMEHGLSLVINNRCGLSTKFLNFYLANDDRTACTPPSVIMKYKTVNDGFDRLGQPINERKIFVSARFQQGDCVRQSSVFFRNMGTKKATDLGFGIYRLAACLRNSVKK